MSDGTKRIGEYLGILAVCGSIAYVVTRYSSSQVNFGSLTLIVSSGIYLWAKRAFLDEMTLREALAPYARRGFDLACFLLIILFAGTAIYFGAALLPSHFGQGDQP